MPSAPDLIGVHRYLLDLQDRICLALENTDGRYSARMSGSVRGVAGAAGCLPMAACSNRRASVFHMSMARICRRLPALTARSFAAGHFRPWACRW